MADKLTTVPTFLDGVFLLANGIADLALVLDSPNCGEEKISKAGIRQDLFTTLNMPGMTNRNQFTNLGFPDMTMGTEPKVVHTVRQTNESLNPAAIMITAGSPIQLTGEYHEMAARQMSLELGKPVFSFASKALSGDFLDGFSDALAALVRSMPTAPEPVIPGSVAVVGMPYFRNEMDCFGNVRELERILTELGLQCLVIMPCGRDYHDYQVLARAEYLIGLPYGQQAAELAAEKWGKPLLQLPLPIGLQGTGDWLRQVALFTGRQAAVEELIDSHLKRTVPLLKRVVRTMFAGKRCLVACEPHLASALLPFLAEFGIGVEHVLLRTRSTSRVTDVTPSLLASMPEVLITYDTTLPDLEDLWRPRIESGASFVIGSTLERAAVAGLPIPFLELDFPSYVRHSLSESPWMGYKGTLWLADRLYNMLSERRYLG